MAASRLTVRLVLPILLITLVVVLGALQYRWLGQVSEAERAQLGRTLNQRAIEFGVEFDREIALASTTLAIDAESLAQGPWSAVGSHYDAWRERALYPAMVQAVYVANGEDGTHTLSRWTPESRTGADVEWPDHLAPVRRSLSLSVPRIAGNVAASSTINIRPSMFTMALAPVVDSVPALVVPIVSRPTRLPGDGDVMVAVRYASTDFLIIELNRQVLVESLIPALVERFFPAGGSDHYRVAILDRQLTPIYSRGFADGELAGRLHVDAISHFFTGARSEFSARMVTEGNLMWESVQRRSSTAAGAPGSTNVVVGTAVSGTTATPASAQGAPKELVEQLRRLAPTSGGFQVFVQDSSGPAQPTRVSLGGWQLFLQHGSGSLDEAVAQARVRNLTTSFSILGVLLAGVGLILVNARKSERLAAQQMEFVATVSHELRTPLAVIRSAGQNLAAGVVDNPEKTRRYGHLIETEGRRLTDMVEEVLEFAGLSGNRRPLALRPVDITSLTEDVLGAHQATLDTAGMQVSLLMDDVTAPVMADEDALRRALSNLIGNAVKYAAEGKWLGVTIRRDTSGDQPHLVIAVADRGPGIAAEDAPRIFEPFYRGRKVVDQQIHGNGLGLSLVARIAESHGGTVSVSATDGGGATFTIRIPIIDVTVHD